MLLEEPKKYFNVTRNMIIVYYLSRRLIFNKSFYEGSLVFLKYFQRLNIQLFNGNALRKMNIFHASLVLPSLVVVDNMGGPSIMFPTASQR